MLNNQLPILKIRPSLDGTKIRPSLDGTKIRPSLDGTKIRPSLDGTKIRPSLDGTNQKGEFPMSKSKIRHLFDGIRPSLDGTKIRPSLDGINQKGLLMVIISQKKPSNTTLLAHQAEISGKTYEVLTTFYAKQTQFPRWPN